MSPRGTGGPSAWRRDSKVWSGRQRHATDAPSKRGEPIAEPTCEPHWTDDVELPLQLNDETWDLWRTLKEIDDRFSDAEMIQDVLYTGRKDAKGAPKTAARIAWEARVEDHDQAANVKCVTSRAPSPGATTGHFREVSAAQCPVGGLPDLILRFSNCFLDLAACCLILSSGLLLRGRRVAGYAQKRGLLLGEEPCLLCRRSHGLRFP
jgi:hypothetical protein